MPLAFTFPRLRTHKSKSEDFPPNKLHTTASTSKAAREGAPKHYFTLRTTQTDGARRLLCVSRPLSQHHRMLAHANVAQSVTEACFCSGRECHCRAATRPKLSAKSKALCMYTPRVPAFVRHLAALTTAWEPGRSWWTTCHTKEATVGTLP